MTASEEAMREARRLVDDLRIAEFLSADPAIADSHLVNTIALALDRRATDQQEKEDRYESALHQIESWSRAYPLTIFPEPDLKKAAELLEAGGITLDAVSASAMRHVVEEVGDIARTALAAPIRSQPNQVAAMTVSEEAMREANRLSQLPASERPREIALALDRRAKEQKEKDAEIVDKWAAEAIACCAPDVEPLLRAISAAIRSTAMTEKPRPDYPPNAATDL